MSTPSNNAAPFSMQFTVYEWCCIQVALEHEAKRRLEDEREKEDGEIVDEKSKAWREASFLFGLASAVESRRTTLATLEELKH